MSFHLAEGATDQHIHRYGGELSPETIRQLAELLRHMKEKCSIYPLPLALVKDRIWRGDTLAKLRSPSKNGYFLPLGLLEPGSYQVKIEGLGSSNRYCTEVISNELEQLEHEVGTGNGEQMTLQFQTRERSEYFLRITSQKPITITLLELMTQAGITTDDVK